MQDGEGLRQVPISDVAAVRAILINAAKELRATSYAEVNALGHRFTRPKKAGALQDAGGHRHRGQRKPTEWQLLALLRSRADSYFRPLGAPKRTFTSTFLRLGPESVGHSALVTPEDFKRIEWFWANVRNGCKGTSWSISTGILGFSSTSLNCKRNCMSLDGSAC